MDQLLSWYGAERYAREAERVTRFWQGEERFLISVASARHDYRQVQTLDDEETLKRACAQLEHQATLPGINRPAFSGGSGTVSTAKHWGGESHFDSTGENIFIEPIAHSVEDALAKTPAPPDHPDLDAARALRLYNELCARLDTTSLWLRTPDMQGPLNTAGQIFEQEEMLIAMLTEPEEMHKFLTSVCSFIIDYAKHLHAASGNRVCGNLWPYTFFPCRNGIAFTEDMMPLLSAEIYREFALPYLRQLGDAFGGLHIHCCGEWARHAENLHAAKLPLRAIECHFPFTPVEDILCLAESTVFIPYLNKEHQDGRFSSPEAYYTYLLENTDESVRYWFAFPEDTPGAVAFAKAHGF